MTLSTGATYDRGHLSRSWLFQLPGAWTAAGTVAFRLEVDPNRAYPDPNRENNSAAQNLTFVGKAPVCNVFVPVRTHAPAASMGVVSDLEPGAATPGSSAGVTVAPNLSRDPLAQADDYGFFVGENGGVYSLKGTGGGAFVLGGPGGFDAQVASLGDRWSAELRIHKDAVGGWDRMVGLAAGHHNVSAANDNYLWPLFAARARPDTWARTALGDLPHINSLSPDTVSAGGAELTLTVKGSGLTESSVVLWAGDPVATTFDSASQVRAQVAAAKIATAGDREVSVRASSTSPLQSNHLPIAVVASAPSLAAVSPDRCNAGAATFNMAVNGTGFSADSRVMWNSELLATTFVSSTRLDALVAAALVADGRTVEIAVHSGGTDGGRTSNTVIFIVQPQVAPPPVQLYLPHIQR